MRRLAGRVIVWCGVTLSLATGASAQAAAAPTATTPWSLSLGLGEAYDSNVNFTSGTGGGDRGDFGTQLDAGAGRSWVGPRGSFRFNGNVAEILYRRNIGLNAFTYGLDLSAAYAVTQRLSWIVGGTLSSAYPQDTKLLTEAGLLLPKVITRTDSASSVFTYALSPRSQIDWGVSGQTVAFSSAQFTSGSRISTSVNISRLLDRSQAVGVSYEYRVTTSNGAAGTIQALLGTWRRTLGQAVTVKAAAGIRPYTLPGESRVQITPALSGSLSTNFSPTQSLVASYERGIEQALGTTVTHETQAASATYRLSVGRRLGLDAGGNYVHGTYPQIPDLFLNARIATVNARFRLVNNLGVAIGAAYYVSTNTPNLPVSGYRASLSLAYRTVWR